MSDTFTPSQIQLLYKKFKKYDRDGDNTIATQVFFILSFIKLIVIRIDNEIVGIESIIS